MGADPLPADSVYDFLYVDLQRLGLLLSQFQNDGILTEIVRETTAGSDSGRGLDLKIVKINAKEDESKGLTRRFNTQWLVPLLFLDATQDRVKTNITEASLGDVVRAKGELSILDTALLQKLYSKDALQTLAFRKAMARAEASGQEYDHDVALFELDAIVENDSHVQMHFHSSEGLIWSTLRPNGLITPASEIAMKHGSAIDGEWHVIGIKDADPIPDLEVHQEREAKLEARFAAIPFLSEATSMSSSLRSMFGRPTDCFGITPLIIFRELGV